MTGNIYAQVPCPRCGPVRVTLADLLLSIGQGGGSSTYEFRCPSCGKRVVRAADARVRRVLARNDVMLTDTGLVEDLRRAGIEADQADDPER